MKQHRKRKVRLEPAPIWAEEARPNPIRLRDVPSLLVLDLPGEGYLEIASADAANAIADPRSALGRVYRQRCGLLALSYVSKN